VPPFVYNLICCICFKSSAYLLFALFNITIELNLPNNYKPTNIYVLYVICPVCQAVLEKADKKRPVP
jgi:hypothetical protein